jgi:hypothetical protein
MTHLSTNVSVQGLDSGSESRNLYYKEEAVVKINENHYAHAQHEERRPAVKIAIPWLQIVG